MRTLVRHKIRSTFFPRVIYFHLLDQLFFSCVIRHKVGSRQLTRKPFSRCFLQNILYDVYFNIYYPINFNFTKSGIFSVLVLLFSGITFPVFALPASQERRCLFNTVYYCGTYPCFPTYHNFSSGAPLILLKYCLPIRGIVSLAAYCNAHKFLHMA